MNSPRSARNRSGLRFTCFLMLTLAAGCGPAPNAPVAVDTARQTLKTALDQWKNGAAPGDLKNANPEIVVQDLDWSGGAQLLDYEVLGDDQPVGANLYAKVTLSLTSSDGKTSQKTVTYCVGTSPVLTVFRDITR